ncbi:hypothetical protein P5G61_05835 [Paenibacillus sp. F6_3S_P_1C]|uniref:Phage protein n=1 Tax=Paenibacillus vandeheii TaxID=3035917 RepID=A0ABT8J6M3_9BACL|nr:hypothetical protein [Paenibacillus vandeheii]MDN4600738.1 hypothetical protein [Paenibacillus vandeheii]
MNEATLSSLIDMIQDMRSKEKKYEDALEMTWGVYDKYIEDLEEIVLDAAGMPRDNSLEMVKIHGEEAAYEHKDMFCRDTATEWFYTYGNGELSKEQLIYNVRNWRELFGMKSEWIDL